MSAERAARTSLGRYSRRWADGVTLAAMAGGLGVLLLPGWERAIEVGFFVTLVPTVAQIVVGHLPRRGG